MEDIQAVIASPQSQSAVDRPARRTKGLDECTTASTTDAKAILMV
jgi:hypothetical protein